MSEDPIEYFDRHSKQKLIEQVYGEKWLHRIYGSPFGRLILWLAVKRSWFSRWYGYRMGKPKSRQLIPGFISKYGLDVSEFAENEDSFPSFNDFFVRRLKPSARPISQADDVAIFPADGRHMGFQDLSDLEGVFVKGQSFDLKSLFGSEETAAPFEQGTLIISRLCPVDYHRFHYPLAGKASAPTLINGGLSSVNPIALRRDLSIFWQNKRNLSYLETDGFGRIASFEVGATCVGSMTYGESLPGFVEKGDEKGFFSFGGSSVLTLFEPNRILLAEDLLEHSAQNRELYARMGEPMGILPK
ncbi:MAG: phosphatidylserine decarboxylase [Verrucomicrobia bacterium]|jgi:phosphatidylserine decarboxylase|nr:phosphatidylserine decarboxylase [Verrucomicrobiota bacterium]MDA0723593.1 phosphatidylserine decarboxylase [Verrucomicrobiota bacterium]MDA1046181.1 phosphatidylserine decarboxylase [Verrucomicrobiota bacterium]